MREFIGKFNTSPMSERKTEISGKRYKVVSHYTGNKDLDKTLYELAEKKAYREIAS